MSAIAEKAEGPTARPAFRITMPQVTLYGMLAVLLVLIVSPLVMLLVTSVSEPGVLFFQRLTFTLQNYVDLAANPGTWRLIGNTLLYAVSSVLIGSTLAVIIAILTERTDMPGRTLVRILMFSWMAVPPLVFAYGWVLLINPGNGVLNKLVQGLFGLPSPLFTPYSLGALVLISSMSVVPTAYVMISGLLRNMDPSLEDAGFVMGASRVRVARVVTLPLLTPGLLSVAMFVFVGMVQLFDLPMALGTSTTFPVLSTRIYLLAAPDMGPPNYSLASTFGVILLLFGLLMIWGYFRATRLSERFRVVSGKGFRPKKIKLGMGRIAAAGFVALYFIMMLLPLLILLWASLLPFYRVPNLGDLSRLTLTAYARVLSEPVLVKAIVNTLIMVAVVSLTVMAMSCLISWHSVRTRGVPARLMDLLAFSPIAIPPVVLAVALLIFYLPTPIYGLIWVIIIGQITIYIAFGTRTMNGAFIQIHKELEDAATISGASWLTTFRRVVLPLVWPQAVNAWLWVVAHSARDLTFPLIMMTGSNAVISTSIFQNWAIPDLPGASALSILMVLALMMLVVPVQIFVFSKSNSTGA